MLGRRATHVFPVVEGLLLEFVPHSDGRAVGLRVLGPGDVAGTPSGSTVRPVAVSSGVEGIGAPGGGSFTPAA